MRAPLNRVVLLVLAAGLLSVGVPATSATAAPVPCTRTFAGPAKAIAPETTPDTAPAYVWTTSALSVPAASNVEDVDVTFDITHPSAKDITVQLTRLVGTTVTHSVRLQPRLTADTGAEPRPLTFDDEATATYTTASGSGTYRPSASLTAFDGAAAGATWRLDVANWHGGTTSRINAWSVRISYSSCDADDDGAEDHTDNCRGLANPDQADLDGDRIGDACDGDPDGDGFVGAADSCPRVPTTTQPDTDADGVGDACDTDDDADGRADGSDGCPTVAAGTPTGCPAVATKVRMEKKKGRLVGRATSDARACASGVEVTLKRVRAGRDQKLVVLRTRSGGQFRTKVPAVGGRYYAVLRPRYAAGVAECGTSRSRPVRVRH
ncbi:thrombospondin type 3 repeat-containing protein [Nocardioides sp.]|uniref:thrombospondin type 3 repeat-containing protein n=1 Tax=Nocardioides sp. TaxID=35761 RepID=UPI0035B35132